MIGIIRKDIQEMSGYVKEWFYLKAASWKIGIFIDMANIKQRVFNRRHFVWLVETPKGNRLHVFDKYEFDKMKQRRGLPKRMTTLELEQECYYFTPVNKNNTLTKEERKKAIETYLKYSGL